MSSSHFTELRNQYEIIDEIDHWPNGLAVQHFRVADVVFRLSFTNRDRDAEPLTYLAVASNVTLPGLEHIRDQKIPEWCPRYPPTFAGRLTVDQAAQFILSIKHNFFVGQAAGYAAAQSDFRKVMGL